MKISIVMSAYNEANRLHKTFPHLLEYTKQMKEEQKIDVEIIVVNDGSKDKTWEELQTYKNDMILVDSQPNHGKGYGLREGVKKATGDYVYLSDVDFSTPIENIQAFIKEITQYDCVIGSRALGNEDIEVSFLRKMLGRTSNLIIRIILGINFKDTQCGFKMFNTEAKKYFLMCKNERFGFDFEFLYLLKKNGLTTKEIPVEWTEVGESTVTAKSYIKTFQELLNVRRMHR